MRQSQIRFIRRQGFEDPNPHESLYAALMLQPRIIGSLFVLGVLLQSPWFFFALSGVLLWSALVPTLSVFDAIYNHVVAHPRGLPPLGAAPAPRRFAQAEAAAMVFAIAAALALGAVTTAWAIQALFAGALLAVILGDYCAGAEQYHLARRGLRRVLARRPQRSGRIALLSSRGSR